MRFSEEKKHSYMMYIIEQIQKNGTDISRRVSDSLKIGKSTVNNYLNELQAKEIIKKIKKNEYQLITEKHIFTLLRDKGELDSDTYAFDNCIKPYITDCSEEAKSIWNYALTEMVNNVMDHSNADILRITIIKNYYQTKIFLTDNGVGIFKKIKEHFGYNSLDEARLELFKGKLTTDEKNHSGEGIFFTSRMMDTFSILSGGKVFSTNKYKNDENFDIENLDDTNGTCVAMTLSNNTHRKISDVFDMYANVDGGFFKTTLPLKNIFDESPVSRSQAKRICNRLDKFTEVTLDFTGIEWMGQGFAHELFAVYQKKHMNMVITPINMNEKVKSMYNHVMNTVEKDS